MPRLTAWRGYARNSRSPSTECWEIMIRFAWCPDLKKWEFGYCSTNAFQFRAAMKRFTWPALTMRTTIGSTTSKRQRPKFQMARFLFCCRIHLKSTARLHRPTSIFVIVLRWRPDASASSRTVQFRAARAILICALVTGMLAVLAGLGQLRDGRSGEYG